MPQPRRQRSFWARIKPFNWFLIFIKVMIMSADKRCFLFVLLGFVTYSFWSLHSLAPPLESRDSSLRPKELSGEPTHNLILELTNCLWICQRAVLKLFLRRPNTFLSRAYCESVIFDIKISKQTTKIHTLNFTQNNRQSFGGTSGIESPEISSAKPAKLSSLSRPYYTLSTRWFIIGLLALST